MVLGAEVLGERRGARQLAVRVVGEAGGKSLRRVVARDEREQRGGIDAAGKQHAGAGGAQAHRFVELFGEGRDRLGHTPVHAGRC